MVAPHPFHTGRRYRSVGAGAVGEAQMAAYVALLADQLESLQLSSRSLDFRDRLNLQLR